MDGLLIAPTEPSALKRMGKVSSLPEKNGVDVLWASKSVGLVGVQRKELRDLVASMNDGRLAKEVAQMDGGLGVRIVLVEGFGKWTSEGTLADSYVNVTRRQVRGFLWSIRKKGIWVEWTENLHDTVQTLEWLVRWTRKPRHTALLGRPKPQGSWGRISSHDYALHLLTSFDGVGVETAEAIVDHFGGVPLRWECDEKDLLAVPGIGKVRAKKLMRALEKAEA